MSAVLPDHILTLMRPEDRATLGKAGLTASECSKMAEAKSEKHLQQQIEAMLRRNGIYVVRQRMDRKSNVQIGTPDFLFAVNGTPAAWEVKMPKAPLREEQREALAEMSNEANGWRTSVVRSYDEALGLFNALLSSKSTPST